MRLAGKVAVVTGGGRGIGRAIVGRLVGEGAAVAVNYSGSEAGAREAVRDAEKAGGRALAVRADVARDGEVRGMMERVVGELGGLDILVNNAGWTRPVQPHRDLEALTDEIWDRVMAVNVKGPFYCVRAAVPHMERRGGGAIVNIGSVAGLTGQGSSLAYAAAKAAVHAMTKSLARALAPAGIRVNAVAPGLIRTGFVDWPDEVYETARKVSPIGRIATVDEAADAVLFYVTNGSMTGSLSLVDGGLTALGPTETGR
ncbi:MAG: SDR family oxidoreductase [Candidatus Rokubacteria bacterium]|nr:SDR family oxidoreductase [Candidatus Rokubacteria bacterium]